MDETRFHSEYEQVSDQLYTFLLRTVGDKELASDILQEAAYRAYRSRLKFKGDSTFKTWIYRIAINAMKNQWSRIQNEKKRLDKIIGMENVSNPSPEQLIVGKEDSVQLSSALMLLEETYRVPFMLKHVDGLSYKEISDVLGITDNVARVRVYRARHTLQKILREDIT